MRSGELLHVGPDLHLQTSIQFPDAPTHQLRLADLHPTAAASQLAANN